MRIDAALASRSDHCASSSSSGSTKTAGIRPVVVVRRERSLYHSDWFSSEVFHVRRLTAATPLLATALLGAPAYAHHSVAMFDASKEILIEGTVARFDWVNPHMY